MGASLAVILAHLWLKEYEHAIKLEIPEWTKPANNCKEMCSHCNKNLPTGHKGYNARNA